MNDGHIMTAATWAAEMHAGQTRPHNNTPYIRHPQRVATRALCIPGFSIQGICAAFLHDVVANCAESDSERIKIFDQIDLRWGSIVRKMVWELTPPLQNIRTSEPKAAEMKINHYRRARKECKRIKLLDRIDNLQEMFTDMRQGLNKDYRQSAVYSEQSRKLLDECLTGVDADLEREMKTSISALSALIYKIMKTK